MIIIIVIRLWNPIYFAKYYQTIIEPLNQRVTKTCCPSLFFHSKSMNHVLVCLNKSVRPNRFGMYWLISYWTEDPFAWSLRMDHNFRLLQNITWDLTGWIQLLEVKTKRGFGCSPTIWFIRPYDPSIWSWRGNTNHWPTTIATSPSTDDLFDSVWFLKVN